ncbi:hypothetical protein GQ53DRAFT_823245 [Thozetella sp. PMI_491]|nr:hypothetical protein GQ53DRAFT_823245 [Thozetella sp. PMI_491]
MSASLIGSMAAHSIISTLAELDNRTNLADHFDIGDTEDLIDLASSANSDLIDLSEPQPVSVFLLRDCSIPHLRGGITSTDAITHGISFAPGIQHGPSGTLNSIRGDNPDNYRRAVLINQIFSANDNYESRLSQVLARVRGGSIERAMIVDTPPWGSGRQGVLIFFTSTGGAVKFLEQLSMLANDTPWPVVLDTMGFGSVNMINSPTFPMKSNTFPHSGGVHPSRHLVLDGLKTKYFKGFLKHVASKFWKKPSVFFDEVYAERMIPESLTDNALAVLNLTNSFRGRPNGGSPGAQVREREINKLITHRLHLLTYNIRDAINLRNYVEWELVKFHHPLRDLKVDFGTDPCDSPMLDMTAYVQDSPLRPVEERPGVVSSTGMEVDLFSGLNRPRPSLLQLFGLRSGEIHKYKLTASEIYERFGEQREIPVRPLPVGRYSTEFRYSHRHRLWDVSLEQALGDADRNRAYQFRIELEKEARKQIRTDTIPTIVDIFTQLDREHRGIKAPAIRPMPLLPAHITESIEKEQKLKVETPRGDNPSSPREADGKIISCYRFIKKQSRLAYVLKCKAYGLPIIPENIKTVCKSQQELFREFNEEEEIMRKSGVPMDLPKEYWESLAQYQLEDELKTAGISLPAEIQQQIQQQIQQNGGDQPMANATKPNHNKPESKTGGGLIQGGLIGNPFDRAASSASERVPLSQDTCRKTSSLVEVSPTAQVLSSPGTPLSSVDPKDARDNNSQDQSTYEWTRLGQYESII